MSLCKGCVSGVRTKGTPFGKIETIGGVETYVKLPESDVEVKDKCILFLTDVFGLGIENNKLIVDDFAKNGYATYAPELFNGDPIAGDAMESGKFDFMAWLKNHGSEQTRKNIDPVLQELNSRYKKVAGLGFCFGARYTVDLAKEGKIPVIGNFHASLLQFPSDIEDLKKTDTAVFWVTNTPDPQIGDEQRAILEKIMKDHKPVYESIHFDDAPHGFMIRGDYEAKPELKKKREEAFAKTIEFLQKHL